MSYLVLARKFRPQTFLEVCGQEHVTRTLANAIKRDRIAHAYLFAGPRGVGKTSIARILAKALNCAQGPSAEPCSQCTNCKEITIGSSMAVREIDGASHNSVDNVRDLIDSFRAMPPPGSRFKVYIIDEVHMLSTAAFNALLKSLEEPPPNTIFILATTEAHKIPETVISRCQRHEFRALRQSDIESRLKQICESEEISIEPEALRMIVRLSEGGMRDAQSLLERVRAFCDDRITAMEASQVLGVVERTSMALLSSLILSRDTAAALGMVDKIFSTGVDPALFLKEFVTFFRELLISRFAGSRALADMGMSPEEQKELQRLSESVAGPDLQDLVHLAREGADAALRSAYPRYVFEALLVRMATREPVQDIAAVLARLENYTAAPGAVGSNAGTVSSQSKATPVSPVKAATPGPVSGEGSAPSARGVAVSVPMDWASFVKFVAESGARMLAEQLKSIAVARFAQGVLDAHGPEFAIGYLSQADNKAKLQGLLAACYGNSAWAIKLSADLGGAPAEAINLHREEEKLRVQARKQKEAHISGHPKIKSLQKAFPGSKIENIRIKNEE